jgi:hypothetical protein
MANSKKKLYDYDQCQNCGVKIIRSWDVHLCANCKKLLDQSNHQVSESTNSSSYSSRNNPFSRFFKGIGFGILIALQILTSPIWLFAFIPHPILVSIKVFRVLISATLTFLMVYPFIIWDILMLAVFLISFTFIRTEKLVVLGYTKELYGWITQDEGFWNLLD